MWSLSPVSTPHLGAWGTAEAGRPSVRGDAPANSPTRELFGHTGSLSPAAHSRIPLTHTHTHTTASRTATPIFQGARWPKPPLTATPDASRCSQLQHYPRSRSSLPRRCGPWRRSGRPPRRGGPRAWSGWPRPRGWRTWRGRWPWWARRGKKGGERARARSEKRSRERDGAAPGGPSLHTSLSPRVRTHTLQGTHGGPLRTHTHTHTRAHTASGLAFAARHTRCAWSLGVAGGGATPVCGEPTHFLRALPGARGPRPRTSPSRVRPPARGMRLVLSPSHYPWPLACHPPILTRL